MEEAVAGRHVGEGQPDQEQEAALGDISSNPLLVEGLRRDRDLPDVTCC